MKYLRPESVNTEGAHHKKKENIFLPFPFPVELILFFLISPSLTVIDIHFLWQHDSLITSDKRQFNKWMCFVCTGNFPCFILFQQGLDWKRSLLFFWYQSKLPCAPLILFQKSGDKWNREWFLLPGFIFYSFFVILAWHLSWKKGP